MYTVLTRESYQFRETPRNPSVFYISNFHKSNPFYPYKQLITLFFENTSSLRINNPLHIVLQAPFIIERHHITRQHAYIEKIFQSMHSQFAFKRRFVSHNMHPWSTCSRKFSSHNMHLHTSMHSQKLPHIMHPQKYKIKNAPSIAFYHIHRIILHIYAFTCIHKK